MARAVFRTLEGTFFFTFREHGSPSDVGGYLVTQEGTPDDPGLPMDDLVTMANNSTASSVLLILDCCFSGAAGNPASLQAAATEGRALLREGVTVLAASRSTQVAMEVAGHGVFKISSSAGCGEAQPTFGVECLPPQFMRMPKPRSAPGIRGRCTSLTRPASNRFVTASRKCRTQFFRELAAYFPTADHDR